jgi:hypothetical protein
MRQHWTDPAAIEAEIARIRSLPLDALRRRWRVMFGRTPPAALSKDLLGRMIACRLQEQAFGSLDRESLRVLISLRCSRGQSAVHPTSAVRHRRRSARAPARRLHVFLGKFEFQEGGLVLGHLAILERRRLDHAGLVLNS